MNPNNEKNAQKKSILRRFVQVFIVGVFWAVLLFLSAGRLVWRNAWIYLGIYGLMFVLNAFLMYARNPDLIAERSRQGEGVKPWDRSLAAAMSLYGPALVLLTAGLNERFGWQPRPGIIVQIIGASLILFGYVVWAWAMDSNPFFSGMVRIQKERGHRAVSAGPYRFVRHPGYAAFVWLALGIPCMLESFWAMLPALVTVAVIAVRTSLEDKTLLSELDGYREYAADVTWRLFPGVW